MQVKLYKKEEKKKPTQNVQQRIEGESSINCCSLYSSSDVSLTSQNRKQISNLIPLTNVQKKSRMFYF